MVLPLLLYWLHQKARRWLVPAFAVLAMLSFACALVEAHRGTNGAYYFAENRAFEFLLATLLALFEFRRAQLNRSRGFDVLFAAGLGGVLLGIFGFSTTSQFPGVGAIVPCGGSSLMIVAGHRSAGLARILSNRPAVSGRAR